MSLLFVAAVAAFTTVAAVSDLCTRRLPNWLTVPAFAAALLMHTIVNGLAGLGFALLGFVVGFSVLLVLWLIGGGGGGDVKLMGALGAWLGASLTLHVFVVSTLVAAVATAVLLLTGMLDRGFGFVKQRCLASGPAGRSTSRSQNDPEARRRRRQQRRLMPFAAPVALGTWMVLAYAWHTSGLPW